jgi:hypothetical protein
MILALAAAVKNTSNATASWRDASLTLVSGIEKGMKKFIPFLWHFLARSTSCGLSPQRLRLSWSLWRHPACTDIAGNLVCNGFFAPNALKILPSILKAPMFMLRLSRFL